MSVSLRGEFSKLTKIVILIITSTKYKKMLFETLFLIHSALSNGN